MNKTVYSAFSVARCRPARRMMGVVLPVVLVVLTVLTGLVVTQIRRNAVDERLSANTRESIQLDSAAQTVLRWCEAAVTTAPLNVRTVNTEPPTAPPAWDRLHANWAPGPTSFNFLGTSAQLGLPNTNVDPSCVIEAATCELLPPISPTGQTLTGCGGIDPRWRKFRITARVSIPAPDMGGTRFTFAQSEVRLFID